MQIQLPLPLAALLESTSRSTSGLLEVALPVMVPLPNPLKDTLLADFRLLVCSSWSVILVWFWSLSFSWSCSWFWTYSDVISPGPGPGQTLNSVVVNSWSWSRPDNFRVQLTNGVLPYLGYLTFYPLTSASSGSWLQQRKPQKNLFFSSDSNI